MPLVAWVAGGVLAWGIALGGAHAFELGLHGDNSRAVAAMPGWRRSALLAALCGFSGLAGVLMAHMEDDELPVLAWRWW